VLFIEADKTLRYQDVFWVFGAVRSAGVTVTAVKL
jgi:biopolymer transport protein ExbD